jgi:DNA-binding beta-propeller fold protein YncE
MTIDRIPRAVLPFVMAVLWLLTTGADLTSVVRGTGDLGVVIERAAGRIQIVETTGSTALATVEGLGDLSHASVVFSRDARYAFVFGRDGGLTKIDLLTGLIAGRVIQAGNSIGGAISQDGRLVAVSNYDPGGVRVFDAETLAPVADIPAVYGSAGCSTPRPWPRSPTSRRSTALPARGPRSSGWSMPPATVSSSASMTRAKSGSPIFPPRTSRKSPSSPMSAPSPMTA